MSACYFLFFIFLSVKVEVWSTALWKGSVRRNYFGPWTSSVAYKMSAKPLLPRTEQQFELTGKTFPLRMPTHSESMGHLDVGILRWSPCWEWRTNGLRKWKRWKLLHECCSSSGSMFLFSYPVRFWFPYILLFLGKFNASMVPNW